MENEQIRKIRFLIKQIQELKKERYTQEAEDDLKIAICECLKMSWEDLHDDLFLSQMHRHIRSNWGKQNLFWRLRDVWRDYLKGRVKRNGTKKGV